MPGLRWRGAQAQAAGDGWRFRLLLSPQTGYWEQVPQAVSARLKGRSQSPAHPSFDAVPPESGPCLHENEMASNDKPSADYPDLPHARFVGGTLVLEGITRTVTPPTPFQWIDAK